jgi:hypothetical protein
MSPLVVHHSFPIQAVMNNKHTPCCLHLSPTVMNKLPLLFAPFTDSNEQASAPKILIKADGAIEGRPFHR